MQSATYYAYIAVSFVLQLTLEVASASSSDKKEVWKMSLKIRRRHHSNWDRIDVKVTLAEVMADLTRGAA